MARYSCGECPDQIYGLEAFGEHVESEHDYPNLSAAVRDCDSIDDPGVIEVNGRKVVKCADCQTLYDAIGAQCPGCKSEDILREDIPK